MRNVLALVLLAFAARAAAAVDAADLVGRWSIDAEATWASFEKSPQFAQVPAEMAATMKDQMLKQLAAAVIEFTKDEMSVSIAGQTKRGAYTVTSAVDDAVGIDVTDPDSKQVQHGEARIVKGQMFLKQGPMEMVLNRKAADAAAAPAPAAAPAKPTDAAPAPAP